MAEVKSLDAILDETPPEKPEVVEAPKVEAPSPEVKDPVERQQSKRQAWQDREQDAQGRVRDPATGQYVPKEVKEDKPEVKVDPKVEEKKIEVKPPVQEFTEKERAFLAEADRQRKRAQALEERLSKLEAGKPKEAEKTFWDDPEGALKRQQDETRQAMLSTRLQTAELIARQRHTDFDEKLSVFNVVVQQTPGLAQQWLASPDPAEFAYQTGKSHKELQEAGNLDQLRAKIEKETEAKVRAKIELELKEKADKLSKERAALPGSLTDARSSGVNKPVWGGPTSLDEILKT